MMNEDEIQARIDGLIAAMLAKGYSGAKVTATIDGVFKTCVHIERPAWDDDPPCYDTTF